MAENSVQEGFRPERGVSGDEADGSRSAEPQYRTISDMELRCLIADHEKWVDTGGKEGKRADLSFANLEGKQLQRVKLQRANLKDANLEGADLYKAQLRGASLTNANLRSARLHEAELERKKDNSGQLEDPTSAQTNVAHANLRGAYLNDAKLSDVVGLLADNLAGANLSNAKLPEDIAKFEGLAHVGETSRNARSIFFGLLLGCAYSWLTIATTTDAQLIINSASSPLPIIQTEIPIAWFYQAAPLILLSVYFYFHLYLLRLWQGLASLPAFFPDGKALDEHAYPWLLNGLVRGHVPLLRENRPALSRLQNFVSIILAWYFVPITLVAIWLRYLPRQDWPGTLLLILYVVMAAAFGMLSYLLARRALRGNDLKFPWTHPWRDGRSYVAAGTVLVAVIVSLFSFGAIEGVKSGNALITSPRTWIPRACRVLQCAPYPFANLWEATLSSRPADWWKADKKAKQHIEAVTGANLRRRSLRFAELSGAFLAKADLRGANLQLANLYGANLHRANLRGADLQGACLRAAVLWGADFQDAKLRWSELQGANLSGANLQGVSDLTQEQLNDACGDTWTKLPPGLTMETCEKEK